MPTTTPDQRGAVGVEFALILPLLVLLVFGIIEFGRGYNAKVELTGAVREGARALALGQSAGDAESVIVASSPGLSPDPSVTAATTCPNGNDRASVTATYDVAWNIPLLASGVWTITTTGVMRCGV